jgi:hypothetical protein
LSAPLPIERRSPPRVPSLMDGPDLLSGFRDFRSPGSHDLENSDFPMVAIPMALALCRDFSPPVYEGLTSV